jgi:putative FmdB family regulatory protein
MPLYEYVCECGEEFELIFYTFDKDSSTAECPECEKEAKKVPSINGRFKMDWSKWNVL